MWRGPLLLTIFACRGWTAAIDDVGVVSVESIRRDVREAAPLTFTIATEVEDLLGAGNAPGKDRAPKKHVKNVSGKSDEGGYYKTYGSDAEGEKGYMTATYNKGNHGYKILDTFHKQDGDKYAFEKYAAYGGEHGDKKSSHHDDAGSRSRKSGDHEGAGTIVDTRYTADEGDHDDQGNEQVEASDHGSYAHYTDHGPESSSYGHGESYADGEGNDGSYETHSSYSRNYGDEHGNQGNHYY
ncbi:uncharacterized protein LOC128885322 [Hylaeus anthracinus]|uniref:uncharacterized protein LOC128885322 n=1 Tax=Hylaeus anthracinus TaxID=313031 RepID=UPI0023B8EF4F|nr:uncharacterized protein LOC128885322 [Hylaeus anthracinus]